MAGLHRGSTFSDRRPTDGRPTADRRLAPPASLDNQCVPPVIFINSLSQEKKCMQKSALNVECLEVARNDGVPAISTTSVITADWRMSLLVSTSKWYVLVTAISIASVFYMVCLSSYPFIKRMCLTKTYKEQTADRRSDRRPTDGRPTADRQCAHGSPGL